MRECSHIPNVPGLSLLVSVGTLRALLPWAFRASSHPQKVGHQEVAALLHYQLLLQEVCTQDGALVRVSSR